MSNHADCKKDIQNNDKQTEKRAQYSSKELLHIRPKASKDFLICKPIKNNSKYRKETFKVKPSSILEKVKTFLPEIEKSNKTLSKLSDQEKQGLNIEEVSGNDKVIEMNLALVDQDLLVSDNETDTDISTSESEEELSYQNNSKVMIEEVEENVGNVWRYVRSIFQLLMLL